MEERFAREITRKVKREQREIKKELDFLDAFLKKNYTDAFFYLEIRCYGNLRAVVMNEDYGKVVSEGRDMIDSISLRSAEQRLYVGVPVTQETISYIGRIGMPGKSLFNNDFTQKTLMREYGFTVEDIKILESSILFIDPDRLE
ncbi:MAG: hypothetical protein WA091_03400 [Minisyncoccales bacterium]